LSLRVGPHEFDFVVLQADGVVDLDLDRAQRLAALGDSEAEREIVAGVQDTDRQKGDLENSQTSIFSPAFSLGNPAG
jgi:hypothetical protein